MESSGTGNGYIGNVLWVNAPEYNGKELAPIVMACVVWGLQLIVQHAAHYAACVFFTAHCDMHVSAAHIEVQQILL